MAWARNFEGSALRRRFYAARDRRTSGTPGRRACRRCGLRCRADPFGQRRWHSSRQASRRSSEKPFVSRAFRDGASRARTGDLLMRSGAPGHAVTPRSGSIKRSPARGAANLDAPDSRECVRMSVDLGTRTFLVPNGRHVRLSLSRRSKNAASHPVQRLCGVTSRDRIPSQPRRILVCRCGTSASCASNRVATRSGPRCSRTPASGIRTGSRIARRASPGPGTS